MEKKEREEFDIVKKLRLEKQAEHVYSTAVRTFKDYFVDNPEELERIIRIFHQNLINVFSKKTD